MTPIPEPLVEAEKALEPFAKAAAIPPIMVGRGTNTHVRDAKDDERFDHPRAITWGMVRRAATALTRLREWMKEWGSDSGAEALRTLEEMANRASVPMDLWDRHARAVQALAATPPHTPASAPPEGTPWRVRTNRHPTTSGEPWGWVSENVSGNTDLPGAKVSWEGEVGRRTAQRIVAAVNASAAPPPPAGVDRGEMERERIAREALERAFAVLDLMNTDDLTVSLDIEDARTKVRAALALLAQSEGTGQ